MSMFHRMKKLAIAAAVASSIVLFAMAPFVSSGARTATEKSWMHSGTRYTLASLANKTQRPIPGRFSWFSSAREVRSLATMNDTLWIGTEGGLFACGVFGDKAVPAPGPVSMCARTIAVRDGALWIGGDQGISVRAGRGWEHFAKMAHPFLGGVRCMAPGESKLWIGTYGNGASYVSGDGLTVLGRSESSFDGRILSIAEETADAIFFGTASGLVSADTLGWKSLRYGSRLPIGAVRCMAFDEDRNLYLSVAGQGVSIYSFGRVQSFPGESGTPGAEVNALGLDPEGRVWAAGASGISIFDGSEWTPYPAPGPMVGKHRYLSLHHDEEGTCYAGTDDGTVVVLSREGAREITVPQAFSASCVPRLRICNGTVWLIAGKLIYSYKGTFAKASAPPELYGAEMTDLLAMESGEIWATTRFGILHYTGRAWEVFDRRNGLPTEYFTRVSRDAAGTLWFATFESGVVAYAGGAWTTYGREKGLPANALADAVVDGAGIPWVVTNGGDVARFSQGIWEAIDLPRRAAAADTSRTADSLSRFDPAIRFLSETPGGSGASGETKEYCLGLDGMGNCLLGTRGGVYKRGANGWQGIELPASLRGARPTAVIGSTRGDIWLGTAGGGILLYRDSQWLRLGASNGLSDDYIRSICEDPKGSVWIGTQYGGVTRYSPPGM